ncbi:MAG: hypothetical protein Q9213_002656 [Squamulea squamosa]
MSQGTPSDFDPEIYRSTDASEATKKPGLLNGRPYSDGYSDPSVNSIPALVEYAAETYKQDTAFIYPLRVKEDSYGSISWEEFHRITDVVASIYSEHLRVEMANANSTRIQPTVLLLGRGTGIEFYITLVGLQKINIRILLVSSTLSPESMQVLYDRCEAVAVIVDEEYFPTPLSVARKIPLMEDPFNAPKSTTSITVTRFEDGLDPFNRHSIIVHSSGSTGVPKPIIHTNRSLLMAKTYSLLPSYHIQNWYLLFAFQGITPNVILPSGLPYGFPTIFPPRKVPPPPEAIFKCLDIAA